MKINKINKYGFTLVELLVSLSIIILITTIFLANYKSTNKRSGLVLATQKLASDIRLIQTYSLGAKENNGIVPPGGWGIVFDKTLDNNTSIIIFADDSSLDFTRALDGSEDVETVDFPEGIYIELLDTSISVSKADLVFLPPKPTTYINANSTETLNIQLSDGVSTTTIQVNQFGLIDVIN